MTESEAIEYLNREILRGNMQNDTQTSAYELAIQALEKQISLNPYYEGNGYADGQLVYDTWICPHCEEYYEVECDRYDYCPNCGQKLNWSDEE